MKNIIKKWISVVLAVIIIESGFITNINMLSFAAIEKPNISSEAAILMDANTKEILFEKNKDNKYSPASITGCSFYFSKCRILKSCFCNQSHIIS